MELQCISLGQTRLLTIDKIYEVIDETENRYSIINDKGIQKNYAKNLFSVIPVEPEIPVVNETGLIVDLDIPNKNNGSIELVVKVNFIEDDVFEFRSFIFNVIESHIGCGIGLINGMNTFMASMEDLEEELNAYVNEAIEDERFTLAEGIEFDEKFIREVTVEITELLKLEFNHRYGILLFSTNITGNDSIYDEALEEFQKACADTKEFYNPNSGNDCEIYTMYTNIE